MIRCLYVAVSLLMGLGIAQFVATIQVYLSNVNLYQAMLFVEKAGYLPVPNHHIAPSLLEFGTALFGGLFLTLSMGIGVSLLSISAAWLWHQLFRRNRPFLALCVVLWILCLILANFRGICPVASLYFLLIPPMVFSSTLKWMPEPGEQRAAWLTKMGHLAPAFLLAVLWVPQMNKSLFLDLRDYVLLPHYVGQKINDFYYDYTLYPAEVLKSLDQKVLKTANLEGVRTKQSARLLEKTLRDYDYLNVAEYPDADLTVEEEGRTLIFEHKGERILRTTPREYLSHPETILKQFSEKSDRYRFLRHFSFFSILIGLPITLYIIFHSLFCLLFRVFLSVRASMIVASILCFSIGIGFVSFFQHKKGINIDKESLSTAMKSERCQDRVAALRYINKNRLEVVLFPNYRELLESPCIPVRYWLIRALGFSRDAESYSDLISLLDDPSPNVVSMAYYALGKKGDRRAINEIIRRIKISDDWYNQWYAYRALRTLGWKQSPSEEKP